MCCHDRLWIDHDIAVGLCLSRALRRDPHGIHAEGRVLNLDAIQFHPAVVTGDCKLPVSIDLVLAHDGRADPDPIAVAVQCHVITNADRWNDKAKCA